MMVRIARRLAAGVALVMFSTVASSKTLYLTCKSVSETQLLITKLYKKPPKNLPDDFYADTFKYGIIGLVLPPPDTWIVDTESRTVRSNEHAEQFTLSNADISSASIHAIRSQSVFELNRINGSLQYTKFTDPAEAAAWAKGTGGELPSYFEWTYSCVAADKPAI